MFFQKTIESCQQFHFNLKSTLLDTLKTSGISANLADLNPTKEGIYFTFPDKTSTRVMLYQAKIQESLFRTQGDPLVHLCACKESLKHYNNPEFLAIIRPNMQFFISIYSHKIQTRFFNEKPLDICPECLYNLGDLFDKNLELFLDCSS